jgi:hypothetical protein
MRDTVATIQAEQDEIIRLDHPEVLVIEGGPGTGKTRRRCWCCQCGLRVFLIAGQH